LAATAQIAGDDLVPAAAVPVTWRLDVGCGFSGWFSEVLGIAAPLSEALPLLWLRTDTCSEGFHEWQAFPGESGAVRRLTHRLLSGADQCGADDDPQGLLHATDLEDGDLPRGRAAVASPAHCAALCTETTPACGAWTHRSSDGACFLKTLDAAHRQLAAPGHVSGVVAAAPSRPRPITVLHGRCDPAVVPRLVADARPGIVVGRWMFESPQLQQYGFGYVGRCRCRYYYCCTALRPCARTTLPAPTPATTNPELRTRSQVRRAAPRRSLRQGPPTARARG